MQRLRRGVQQNVVQGHPHPRERRGPAALESGAHVDLDAHVEVRDGALAGEHPAGGRLADAGQSEPETLLGPIRRRAGGGRQRRGPFHIGQRDGAGSAGARHRPDVQSELAGASTRHRGGAHSGGGGRKQAAGVRASGRLRRPRLARSGSSQGAGREWGGGGLRATCRVSAGRSINGDAGDRGTDRHHGSRRRQHLGEDPLDLGNDLDHRLVRLDLRDRLSDADPLADGSQPPHDAPGVHVRPHPGHDRHLDAHQRPGPTVS